MAYANTLSLADTKSDLTGRFAARVARLFSDIAENNPRLRQVRVLQSLSDSDLARLGLTRDDIVRHVFRDVYYA